jgi:hypothetical protein
MRTPNRVLTALVTVVGLAAAPPLGAGEGEPTPLAAFDRLVGGRWCLEGWCSSFEWGVGRRVLRGRMTAPDGEGGEHLVTEGQIYWHPGDAVVKGVFASAGTPIDLYEYDLVLEGDTLTGQLRGWSAQGLEELVELWEFEGQDRYRWSVWAETGTGREKRLGGVFERLREEE